MRGGGSRALDALERGPMSFKRQSSYVSPATPYEIMLRALVWAGVGTKREVMDLSPADTKSLYVSLCALKDAEWRAQGGEGESLGFLV